MIVCTDIDLGSVVSSIDILLNSIPGILVLFESQKGGKELF